MKSRFTWVLAVWSLLSGAAYADGPVVVELFSSQGCSSCPPADKLLGQIAGRDDVIALSLHVDYWDYLGWKDDFADPSHTVRQRAYARAAGKRMIYTPQMVVGGTEHIVGSKPLELTDALRAHGESDYPADVRLTRRGDRIRITVTSEGGLPSGGAVVQLVTFAPKEQVSIRRGENAGRTLVYHNIVRNWVEVGRWNGSGVYRATVQVPEGLGIAVLVQAQGPGRIYGAAKIN